METPKIDFKPEKLLSKATKRKVFNTVVILHIAVLFLPLSVLFVAEWVKSDDKKIDAIKVTLVEPGAKRSSKPPKLRPASRPKPPKPPKKIPPKKPEKKNVAAEPELNADTPIKKNIPDTKTINPNARPVKKNPKSPTVPTKKIEDDFEIVKDTREFTDDQDESENSGDAEATYEGLIAGVVYKLWVPPSKLLLNGRTPSVTIKLVINSKGTILSKKIISRSNFKPMNYSVEELLDKLDVLPVPGDNPQREFEIILQANELD